MSYPTLKYVLTSFLTINVHLKPVFFLLMIFHFAFHKDNEVKLISAPNFSHCLSTTLNALCRRDLKNRKMLGVGCARL